MAAPRTYLRACLLAIAAAGALVWAQESRNAPPAQSPAPKPNPEPGTRTTLLVGHVSMDQAIKLAEQRYKARVVRAESQQSGDRTVYVLRMLNEHGRVWTVRVDATNGAVL